jgi:hypothetical protein
VFAGLAVVVAGPIRFRRDTRTWDSDRVDRDLYAPLADRFGATRRPSAHDPPPGYEACQLRMDNGDLALFAWGDKDAYWLGNTETPETLWRTNKHTFAEAPYPVARWAQRELLTELQVSEPWLAEYAYVSWYFLPVLFSKDGRETTREFFRDHAAGFPDATREDGLTFYEDVLTVTGLDDHRYTMASKLGTSKRVDLVRMRATMAEFNAAKLLTDAGYEYTPEVALDSGHALDFRVHNPETLVEVTRPEPPARRRAGTPAAALRETVTGKSNDQLSAHNEAVVFVDCSSFRDDEWNAVAGEQPAAGHEPAVVYRMRPDGHVAGYTRGDVGLRLDYLLE